MSKICFNKDCGVADTERWRKGWRLRSGELSDLCDRCGSAYEESRFCEGFHLDVAGWRTCETCGKRIHCGCVASVHTYILLDTGGIECMLCARKSILFAAPNQIWPSPMFLPLPPSDRLVDRPVNAWSQIAASNSCSGQVKQVPPLGYSATNPSEFQCMQYLDGGIFHNIDKSFPCNQSTIPIFEKKRIIEDSLERKPSHHLKNEALGEPVVGHTSIEPISGLNTFHSEEEKPEGKPDCSRIAGGRSSVDARKSVSETDLGNILGRNLDVSSSCISVSRQSLNAKDDISLPLLGLGVSVSSPAETMDATKVSGCETRERSLQLFPRQYLPGSCSGFQSSGDLRSPMRIARPRGEGRGKNQLLPRYYPRITDQEIQQITGDSNSVITPLFEKMLSASDAGRIGRLVLPKKCAEAYFPSISQPEGLPLRIQDARGKEWVFQFRFWPNNNSRMYVLEGVTPCIQSMQLQAGDTVTFSRMDPEGKLVMGFRKAASAPSEQDAQVHKQGNGISTIGETNHGSGAAGEATSALPFRSSKGATESTNYSSNSQFHSLDPALPLSRDKEACMSKEGSNSKSLFLSDKRKSSTLGSKSKRLRIDNEDSIELKLTWEEAQDLLRPPPNHPPNVVIIEGHEIEEYKEPPVIGKSTIFATNKAGEKYQWVQCDNCAKWRKLPMDVLVPPRWTCADNSWDPKRSSCSSAQELSTEQTEHLLQTHAALKRIDQTTAEGSSAGLDALADAAILRGDDPEEPTSTTASPPTTRHPRHRPGCSCIVCIQPPSGKGPKHKPNCTCNVCMTVKRRFRTLMMRRKKRQEAEIEASRKALISQMENVKSSDDSGERKMENSKSDEDSGGRKENVKSGDDDSGGKIQEDLKPVEEFGGSKRSENWRSSKEKASSSLQGANPEYSRRGSGTLKGRIDLNCQPEREDELGHFPEGGVGLEVEANGVGPGGYEVETGRGALGTSRREADVASGSGSGSG
ncbi:B3 domain-containing transcription repressor VAL2 isoform X1 [Amborella trichopoda]|uniref:CW-type domain-containing protein n=1 Tax=Amborella trichopoda TaxID=13333 RepID=W1P6B2_AMBTC|nr:B3 domain-containing transcription repressor VAL2 isoform X1 [Amborella trichopoda]ERN03458.1 hypothetical protein AMTR_s00003p00266720 [Amborella trichopoda]|eukprot:XP_006841783.1 B3 domain-containing transcription repressor VAL2 isoform X1 [Amborella trichopoda]